LAGKSLARYTAACRARRYVVMGHDFKPLEQAGFWLSLAALTVMFGGLVLIEIRDASYLSTAALGPHKKRSTGPNR
jgi:hypothetical protein